MTTMQGLFAAEVFQLDLLLRVPTSRITDTFPDSECRKQWDTLTLSSLLLYDIKAVSLAKLIGFALFMTDLHFYRIVD